MALNPNDAAASAASRSGQREYPVISAGKVSAAASTVSGIGGGATAMAMPNSYWLGPAVRATSTGDATGLYGGSVSADPIWTKGDVVKRAPHGESTRRPTKLANGDVNFGPLDGTLGGFGGGMGDRSLWGGGPNTQTSYGGAQVFDAATYGVSGVGGPIAVAAAREAVAASQAGSAKTVERTLEAKKDN